MISVVIISKDEPDLDETLTDLTVQLARLGIPGEIIVVDASSRRLEYIKDRHAGYVTWFDFDQPKEIRVSIPHQRNFGVRAAAGEIIVFTDAGARPHPDWLEQLVAPLQEDEKVVAGVVTDLRGKGRYEKTSEELSRIKYVEQAPTINFAFKREVFNRVGEFDESFSYGSDTDFCWRLVDAGYRIRRVGNAVVQSDWGTARRQRRRSYLYGKARAQLYKKHAERRKHILRTDPIVVAYPLFLLGLPLTLIFPAYPLLLLLPAWRNRHRGAIQALDDHLWLGAGVLAEIVGL
jgi:cellulose synthase/poly-beta-1,6-N-acetylglucosamine synthase-like glycosyltransferase